MGAALKVVAIEGRGLAVAAVDQTASSVGLRKKAQPRG